MNLPDLKRALRLLAAVGAVALCVTPMLMTEAAAQRAPERVPGSLNFNRDIRPILSDKCFKCHGPGAQMAGLRLDMEDAAKRELRSGGSAVVPGDPGSSKLIQRITATDPKTRMPRGGVGVDPGEPLNAGQIALFQRWIEDGATWEKHWSFIPPARPSVPAVKDPKWVHNPIDAFVLQRLEREGLKPTPQAAAATLLRRVTLDLTGLPPTPLELEIFLADKSPNAFEKVVDRLLQSPRYGERMAFPWLEAARYADSIGYQRDGARYMWRWRDWVINAFNRNMPYDQFTVEQLAGDLLPNPTLDQRIATGFNRNHRGNAENGIIAAEYAVEQVVDRVDTTSTVFLGLTLGCARCHNHKYDPLTQKEYYQLFSYFNNVPESGRARQAGNSPPFIVAPTAEQQIQVKQFEAQVALATRNWDDLQPQVARAQQEWERSLSASPPAAWAPARGLVAHYAFDGDVNAQISVSEDGRPSVMQGEARFVPGAIGQALSIEGQSFVQGADIAGFAQHGFYDDKHTVIYDDPYTLAAWIYPTAPTGAIVTKAVDTPDPRGHGLNLKDGKLQYNYVFNWVDAGIRVETGKTVSLNQWHHVMVTYDGTRWASGVKLYLDGEPAPYQILLNEVNTQKPNARRETLRIGGGGGPANRFHGSIDDVRIYKRVLTPLEAQVLADRMSVPEIAALAGDKRSPAQREKIRDYFIEQAAPAAFRTAWNQVLDARARRDAFYQDLPTVMVMEEMPTPRESHVLIRGVFDRPGEKVTPGVPSVLPGSPTATAYPPNRLGLARWLTDPANPLMARVTVNRFWQQYFGTGIVKSTENFGSQGDPPSHPELLDWLATEFVRSGWDVKALQKTIVMSATYRQASSATPARLAKDPANSLLARGPNLRLSAEMIRDQALAVSGLLVNRIGGPSVKPYQPEGLWAELLSGGDPEEHHDLYVQDHGESLYRRSLYTYWKRTVPPPTMANFDASSREVHVVRSSITNTPLQALTLMNDVTYLEAARVLGERMMREGGRTPQDRIAFAFRLATCRLPSAVESTVLLDSFNHDLKGFETDPEAALEYVSHGEYPRDEQLSVPDLAAYTGVASLILNLNQMIMKD